MQVLPEWLLHCNMRQSRRIQDLQQYVTLKTNKTRCPCLDNILRYQLDCTWSSCIRETPWNKVITGKRQSNPDWGCLKSSVHYPCVLQRGMQQSESVAVQQNVQLVTSTSLNDSLVEESLTVDPGSTADEGKQTISIPYTVKDFSGASQEGSAWNGRFQWTGCG